MCYYFDRIKDLCKGKDLVFVSFRKSFQKDIVPATISSWIKQTVLLCYQLSDEKAHKLYQVRAHDVRAFAAFMAFQGGVSLDQTLSVCHWKAHNTITQVSMRRTPVPARAQLRTFFFMFGKTGRAPDKCICPLGEVITYKI